MIKGVKFVTLDNRVVYAGPGSHCEAVAAALEVLCQKVPGRGHSYQPMPYDPSGLPEVVQSLIKALDQYPDTASWKQLSGKGKGKGKGK